MYLKELIEKLSKAYEECGNVEVTTCGPEIVYNIKSVKTWEHCKDEVILELE